MGSAWRRKEEEEEEGCSTRRSVRSNCRTEEVEPGRFVRKCDKTVEILRDCVGRPPTIVESNSEHTEEDVTDEVKSGHLSFGGSGDIMEPFSFPGIRGGFSSDVDAMERSILGGLDSFVRSAEELKNEFFNSFGMSSSSRDQPPFFRQVPIDEGNLRGKDANDRGNASAYDEFAGKVTDV